MVMSYINVVIDTCVWIDLANGKYDEGQLELLEDLVEDHSIFLVIPEQILNEWNRNKEERVIKNKESILNKAMIIINDTIKVAKSASRSDLSDQLELTKLTLEKTSPEILKKHEDLSKRIDALFHHQYTTQINLNETKKVLNRVVDSALKNTSPFFYEKKKSTGDAVIFFSILEFLENNESKRVYFISTNGEDFGKGELHSNLADLIEGYEFTYFMSLPKAIEDMKEWSNDIIEYLKEEEHRTMEENNEILYIGHCDSCHNNNQMGRWIKDRYGVHILSFCLECC